VKKLNELSAKIWLPLRVMSWVTGVTAFLILLISLLNVFFSWRITAKMHFVFLATALLIEGILLYVIYYLRGGLFKKHAVAM